MILSKEQELYLLDNYIGITTTELAGLLNHHFHTNFTRRQIKNYLQNHGLRNGVVKRFEKGHVPLNKGKRMSREQYEKSKPTMFKKGNVPANRVSIGTEKEKADGYVWVKIQDGQKNKNWKLKHVFLWEKENGPLPKGHMVIFLDSDNRNFDLKNLKAIAKATNARLNQNHLRYGNKDLTEAGIAVAELITSMHNRKKKR